MTKYIEHMTLVNTTANTVKKNNIEIHFSEKYIVLFHICQYLSFLVVYMSGDQNYNQENFHIIQYSLSANNFLFVYKFVLGRKKIRFL